MRILFTFLLLIFLQCAGFGQVREVLEAIKPKKKFTGTPVIAKKDNILYAGLSGPNKLENFLNFGGLGSLFSTSKKATGPFLLSYEKLVKDNLGLGLSFSYASASNTYSGFGSGKITGDIKAFTTLLSTYYHIYTTARVDAYTKGSIGFTIWKGSYTDQNGAETQDFSAPAPVSYQALTGLRYFPNNQFFIAGELGFSNTLKITAGLNLGFKL